MQHLKGLAEVTVLIVVEAVIARTTIVKEATAEAMAQDLIKLEEETLTVVVI